MGRIRDMFDTMTMTKIVGGFCGMLLVFLLGNWAGESLYHVGGHGHGDEHAQAYVIDTGESHSQDGDSVAVQEISFSEVYASADPAAGERLFKACRACHKVEDGANGTGPHLFRVVGRAVAAVAEFRYSGALAAVVESWGPEQLNGFLENPKSFAPGTKMAYRGMKDIEDRANLIAWLESIDG